MDTRFLTTFIEVVNTRHFGKAAENLYLTQSAVSARIKLLEEYFQTPLFERYRNSIQLTSAGERLLPYAKTLCETLERARSELQHLDSQSIMIGANQLAGDYALSFFVQKLQHICPDWVIKADVMSMEGLSRRLHERMIDVAISTEPLKSEHLDHVELCRCPLGLFSFAENVPITSITADKFIDIDWGTKAHEALVAQYPQLRDAKMQTNMLQVAQTLLTQQGGLVVLPLNGDSFWSRPTHATLLTPINNAQVVLYLNTLKSVRRTEVSAIIESVIQSLLVTE